MKENIKNMLVMGSAVLALGYFFNFMVHYKNYQKHQEDYLFCQELRIECLDNKNNIDEFVRCMKGSCSGEEINDLEDLASEELYSAFLPGYGLLK